MSCTALAGNPDDFLSATHCWINDSEARPNVAYVLDPGDTLVRVPEKLVLWAPL